MREHSEMRRARKLGAPSAAAAAAHCRAFVAEPVQLAATPVRPPWLTGADTVVSFCC